MDAFYMIHVVKRAVFPFACARHSTPDGQTRTRDQCAQPDVLDVHADRSIYKVVIKSTFESIKILASS